MESGGSGLLRNIRLVVAYDGTPFLGWQVQPQGPTVQSVLQEALLRITGRETVVKGSGRTDAGVHALGQVANFQTTLSMSPAAFVRSLNSMLPPAVAILGADEVQPGFDAQFSAVGKSYRYRVFNSTVRSPFEVHRSWFFHRRLNIEEMRRAACMILGTHDFSSFRASGCAAMSPVRTVHRCDVAQSGDVITFYFTANGFLRHMVRNIVGSLVEVGRGRFSTKEFGVVLAARDRRKAGIAAPPQGLYLVRVTYPPEVTLHAAPGLDSGASSLGFRDLELE